MRTLIQPNVKLKIASFDNSHYQVKEKLTNAKLTLDSKFYQKLFVILFTSCVLLMFPESPQDSEALCKKYNSSKACMVL